ncbi:MAG: proteasome subunit beta [Ignisphaera sp.]|uniref:Proteasome subunit beta n=1 Tax=Ignisphaera aggregans TaxID=334771 RepID=A0A7J3N050_9CREN
MYETGVSFPENILRKLENVYKGTTTIGMRVREFVVLAADKKATAGLYVAHKNVKKIAKISNNCALTIAGLVADAQTLADYLRVESHYYQVVNRRPMSIRSMASLLGLLLNEYKYFPFIVQLLLGGYDYYEGPRLFAIELYGDVTEEKYAATGSGSPLAISIIESNYTEDLDLDDSIKLAVKAVAAASSRDVFSGGVGIDVVIIGKNMYREHTFQGEEIKNIVGRIYS